MAKKITKKEIAANTLSTMVGFGRYRYNFSCEGNRFDAQSEEGRVYDGHGIAVGCRISNKKEFVDVIYNYLNH